MNLFVGITSKAGGSFLHDLWEDGRDGLEGQSVFSSFWVDCQKEVHRADMEGIGREWIAAEGDEA